MPALPDVPQVLRFDFQFIIGEDLHAKCRRFLRYSGDAPSDAQLDTVAASTQSEFGTLFAGRMASSVIHDSLKITDLTSPTAAVGQSNSGVTGTGSGAGVPASAAVVTSYSVHRRYRGGHPRNYWPFGTESSLHDNQTWSSSFVGDLDTQFAAFDTFLKALTWTGATIAEIVNVSFYNGFTVVTTPGRRAKNINVPRTTPLVDAITGTIVNAGIGSVRRRLLKLA